ncbi:hypothetical protein RHGRI_026974 [Rhododendron griersonianum]|uniref:Uncharacterized protein n=1 Tax=Rhododendron griersonianum TaxID=479676 RepID=A0AAV6IY76_9ERIC|nr:hypothetical protein RHGRI_026974 [Rhododendron griersonianum]
MPTQRESANSASKFQYCGVPDSIRSSSGASGSKSEKTQFESSSVRNLKDKGITDFRDKDFEDEGHHTARLTNRMTRYLRTMRFMASKNRILRGGGRHMAGPIKRRACSRKCGIIYGY